jgi:dTDP-4-dehydrorhamnose reductase
LKRRIALIGANGQLGQDLKRFWAQAFPQDDVASLTHADIEISDRDSVAAVLGHLRPHLAINTAAYHKVDEVEEHPGKAFEVNATGVRNLALECRDLDCTLLHMSTDYVFAGSSRRPYVESDVPDPVNVYGASKIAGEMLIRYVWPKHFVVRTSGLYGIAGSSGKGGNFVELMLRLAQDRKPIRVVNDQVLTPTGTWPLAQQLATLVGTDAFGTYHATCQGACTWYGFAREIFRLAVLEADLSPQSSVESGAKARRPPFSVLDNRELKARGIDNMPGWKESLADYLERRGIRAAAGVAPPRR